MDKVKVRKEELLNVLHQNRDNHRGVFERAVEGYKEEAVKQLNDHIDKIRSGSLIQVQVYLPKPVDHTDDYDRAIRMAEMSVDDEIELSNRDFQQYVMDEWGWKQEFAATSSMYTDI